VRFTDEHSGINIERPLVLGKLDDLLGGASFRVNHVVLDLFDLFLLSDPLVIVLEQVLLIVERADPHLPLAALVTFLP
jgi:hypothetical protein